MASDQTLALTDDRRHVSTNLTVEKYEQNLAVIRSYVTITCIRDGQVRILATGTNRDTLSLEGDVWKVAEHEVHLDKSFRE
jgi:hypothetical protein